MEENDICTFAFCVLYVWKQKEVDRIVDRSCHYMGRTCLFFFGMPFAKFFYNFFIFANLLDDDEFTYIYVYLEKRLAKKRTKTLFFEHIQCIERK